MCVEAREAIRRSRSLFGTPDADAVPSSADQLGVAIETGRAAHDATVGMDGGSGVPGYRDMVDRAMPPLNTSAASDRSLSAHITSAAAASQAGARQLDTVAAQVDMLTKMAPTADSAAEQRAVLTALRAQVQQASTIVRNTQQVAAQAATQVRGLKYPADPPASPGSDVHALDDKDKPPPPHGHDPRYWIDVTKIIHVPDGELAPNGTKQIGPNLWYPSTDQGLFVTGDPPPAKWPIDMKQIEQLPPGQLPQMGMTELGPGFYAPTPRGHDVPPPSWSPPQAPIDIRDIVHVPPGSLAPNGFREYAPGWWAPDVSNDSYPHLPPRR